MAGTVIGSLEYDKLFAGSQQPIVTNMRTVASGEGELPRGAVMGQVTASGKLRLVNSAHTDGSEKPFTVLAEPVDATAADVPNTATYDTGEYNIAALTFGGTDTYATHADAAARLNIYFRQSV